MSASSPTMPPSTLDPQASGEATEHAIAIIGIAGRFAKARDLNEFWCNLRDGVEGITFFSDAELLAAGISSEEFKQAGYVKARGVLEDVEMFDADFFGYNHREAQWMDPQQRLFLECAHQTIEHAGYACGPEPLHIGVFAGCSVSSYLLMNVLPNSSAETGVGNMQVMIGNDKDYLASRVSYKLNLTGPSMVVQTACSTSLTAVHVACQSLLGGECDMALAGGVCVSLPQVSGYLHQTGSIASADGHCRPFDAHASGTNGGSGVGAVLLKRLADAMEDGDSIYAVIRGSAINNDGTQKVGYTAPSQDGQAAVIAEALAVAGVEARHVGYIEAHGTATRVGDPIEVAALTQVFRESTRDNGFCAIGSVKSNLGHLDAAAGIAGLLKTVLALRHGQIPASLNFSEPNPTIDFAQSPFFVATQTMDWPQTLDHPRIAGVSSFGIGGSNVHVVLQAADQPVPSTEDNQQKQPHLLVFSARSAKALQTLCTNFADFLRANPQTNLADAAHTLRVGRTPHAFRHWIVACDVQDAINQLQAPVQAIEARASQVAFLLTGQGVELVNAGRGFYDHEPVFREAIEYCSQHLRPTLGLDLVDLLYPPAEQTATARQTLANTRLAQPALLVIEYALMQLLGQFNIKPDALLGHSLGQYSAGVAASIFGIEQALTLVAKRGELMQALEDGAMLSVQATEDDTRTHIQDLTLDIAALNSPDSCVVAGRLADIEALEQRLDQHAVAYKRSSVNRAFHSRLTDACLQELGQAIVSAKPQAARVPVVCNVTGQWLDESTCTDPDYWRDHTRQPVRFADGLHTLAAQPNMHWIEVGPAPVLSGLARRNHLPTEQSRVRTLTGQTPEELLQCLGELWAAGISVDWTELQSRHTNLRRIALPTYPFERQRFWIDPPASTGAPAPLAQVTRTAAVGDASVRKTELADYLLTPQWVDYSYEPSSSKHQTLLWMAPATERAQAIAQALTEQGITLISIEGLDQINAHNLDQCDAMVYAHALEHDGTVLSDQALERSFFEVMALGQALSKLSPPSAKSLIALTSRSVALGDSRQADPFQVALVGAARQLPTELPWLEVRCIDVADDAPASKVAELIHAVHDPAVNQPVWLAVSQAQTRQWCLSPLPRARDAQAALPLKKRGVYWIIGATGGVGRAIARELASQYQARLALTARHATAAIDAIGSLDHAWLEQTGAGLQAEHQIVTIRQRDGLEQQLRQFSGALVWAYWQSAGLDITAGRSVPIASLKSALAIERRYDKFFNFMLKLLVDLKLIRVVDDEIMIETVSEDADVIGRALLSQHPGFGGMIDFMQHCASHYPEVLSGQTSGVSVLYPQGNPDQMLQAVARTDEHTRLRTLIETTARWIEHLAQTKPDAPLRILEVGGGHGVLADAVRERVTNIEYCFTDIGKSFVDRYRDKAHQNNSNDNLVCKVLDIGRDPAVQGFADERFDLILAMNVVHVTPEIGATLENLHQLLQPGGGLLMIESVLQEPWVDLVWGLSPGWWAFEDEPLRSHSPLIATSSWCDLLKQHRYTDVYTSDTGPGTHETSLIIARRDPHDQPQYHTLMAHVLELESLGAEVMVLPADVSDAQGMRAARETIESNLGPINGVIHSAMVLDDTLLTNKTRAQALRVLAPKALAVRALDQTLADVKLDFMVLSSSMSAIDPGAGQFDYAAANAVVDAYANYANRDDRRVVSINWNRWSESGFVARLTRAHLAQDPQRQQQRPPDGQQALRHFDKRTDWLLQEHSIGDRSLLPGTALVESIVEVWLERHHAYPVEIKDLHYVAPCWADPHGRVTLSTKLEPLQDTNRFEFFVAHQNSQSLCSLGTIGNLDNAETESPVDLASWLTECHLEHTTSEDAASTPALLGPRWQSLEFARFNTTKTRAVALIKLDDQFKHDLVAHRLHPALLDLATGFACSGNYLPASIERIVIYRALPASLYSLVDIRPDTNQPCLDITVVDPEGAIVLRIEGYTLRPPKQARVLCQTTVGELDTLSLQTYHAPTLGDDEVEIEVLASSLNFKDALLVAGLLPTTHEVGSHMGGVNPGAECAGRIIGLGARAKQHWRIGQAVIATTTAAVADRVVAPGNQVYKKPQNLSFADASSLPVAFATAAYALQTLGQIKSGQTVLIHSATGGVGLAAIQIAQRAGATIFATAGNPEKRNYLKSLGLEHVMDSRSTAFVEDIMQATGGRGVDLALSALAGPQLLATLSCIATGGIHLELGRRDITAGGSLPLEMFSKGIGFFAIDFGPHNPAYRKVMTQLVRSFEEGELQPLPRTLFTLSQAREAFELLLASGHMGKVIVASDLHLAQQIERQTLTQDHTLHWPDTHDTLPPTAGLTDKQGWEVLTLALRSQKPQVAVVSEPALRAKLLQSVDSAQVPSPPLPTSPQATAPQHQQGSRVATDWQTPTQQQVALIWQSLLGQEVTSPAANFFDLRGDSLLAISVIAKIRQAFGVALEASALFNAPTVQELAALIDHTLGKTAAAPAPVKLPTGIVPLSRDGTRAPLFLAPPIMGTLFPYMEFALLLKADRPVYGLSPRLTKSGAVAWKTMQEQARFYVEDILEVQPEGPYFIGGWSFGATVAFEVVRQLERRGKKVALFAAIDYPAQGSAKSDFLDFVRFFGASTIKSLTSYLRDYIYLRQERSKEKSSSWMRRIAEDAVISKVMTPEARESLESEMQVPELMRIYRANATALSKYRPGEPYHGRVDLFRTTDHAAKRHNHALEWDQATTGRVVVHDVGGTHMTIMRSPHVGQLAKLIKQRLERIDAQAKGQSP